MSGHARRYVRRSFTEKLPEDVQLVARPSRWGNPYRVDRVVTEDGAGMEWAVQDADGTVLRFCRFGDQRGKAVEHAVQRYANYLRARFNHDREELVEFLRPLFRKRLACYCPKGGPCHVDALIVFVEWAEEWDALGRAVHAAQLAIAKFGKGPIVIERRAGGTPVPTKTPPPSPPAAATPPPSGPGEGPEEIHTAGPLRGETAAPGGGLESAEGGGRR